MLSINYLKYIFFGYLDSLPACKKMKVHNTFEMRVMMVAKEIYKGKKNSR
jgi:hypothetical protein